MRGERQVSRRDPKKLGSAATSAVAVVVMEGLGIAVNRLVFGLFFVLFEKLVDAFFLLDSDVLTGFLSIFGYSFVFLDGEIAVLSYDFFCRTRTARASFLSSTPF